MIITCPKCNTPYTGPVNLARHGPRCHGGFRCASCGWLASLDLTEAEYAELLETPVAGAGGKGKAKKEPAPTS